MSDDCDGEYVEIALPVPLRRAFSYRVPEPLRGKLRLGCRVAVPFNRRKLAGFVVGFSDTPPDGVKRISKVAGMLEEVPVFEEELLSFLTRAAQYYLHPIGEVLKSAAPALPKDAMRRLEADGFLNAGEKLPGQSASQPKTLWLCAPSRQEGDPKLGSRQANVLSAIRTHGPLTLEGLRAQQPADRSVIRSLVDKGLVTAEEIERPADRFFREPVARDRPPEPTGAQAYAIDAVRTSLEEGSADAFLLHGVTGSGKTEVYLRAIECARRLHRGAMLLVPEIALTPQLVGRFRARFGDDIAVLHSGLTARARVEMWRALRRGELSVVIGARSALFAPIQSLGLVIVDEEHDPSFKQEEGFRYHARDMALLRAKMANAVCILGSATPSVETYHAANEARLRLLSLPERASGRPMPTVEIVNLREHPRGPTGTSWLSGPLFRALEECFAEGGRAILFLNRRGFAPSLRCESCGEIAQCPACSVALTEHRAARAMRCHYCDFSTPPGESCTACGQLSMVRLGLGTEQLQDALAAAFPEKNIGRLDRDTAARDGVETILRQLRSGEIDVLVGTQMVTKGHDIPSVTLVGVVLADLSLSFPDFRANERTFQLLAQVAGRSGRGERPGRVMFQTYVPDHTAVRCASSHDYEGFFEEEIETRKAPTYPPWSRLVAIRVDAGAEEQAKRVAQLLRTCAEELRVVEDRVVEVLGPAVAPIARLRGRYRYRILLRSSDRKALRGVAIHLVNRIDEGIAPARAFVDVDPVSML